MNNSINRIAFSCVVDQNPRFVWQCFILINTLIHNAGVKPHDIYVHIVGLPLDIEEYLKGLNVNVLKVKRWGDGKYCNKLVQFDTLALSEYGFVFLCDCDIAFAHDIRSLSGMFPDSILAKTVDASNPPLHVLNRLYERHKIPKTQVVNTYYGQSFATNCNGGLIGIPHNYFCEIGNHWRNYASKLLCDKNSIEILKNTSKHIDQISLSMAISATNQPLHIIDTAYNTPTHSKRFIPAILKSLNQISPHVLHYHDALTNTGLLKSTGHQIIDRSIRKVNRVIQNNFCNKMFWNYRYAVNPALGSGAGSRGHLQIRKQKLLRLAGVEKVESVLDIGCGDGDVVNPLNIKNYMGVDCSNEALSISKLKRPGGSFFLYKDISAVKDADIVICLDVLSHQDAFSDYEELIACIARKAKKRLIVSGYNKYEEDFSSCMCRYYEDIRLSLEKTKLFKKIFRIDSYRGLDVLIADKVENIFNLSSAPNDMNNADIEHAYKGHSHPDSFRSVVEVSRAMFGWYTKHYPRIYEYPWILEIVGMNLQDKTIVDFGAGISPLPLLLSARGAKVKTFDNGSHIHFDSVSSRNEWGFFDYSIIDKSIVSFNDSMTSETCPEKSIDIFYSVSVIEHLKANVRKKILSTIRNTLKTNGKLLLTVDLKKSKDDLWNYSAGKIVEPISDHGSIATVINELELLGFGDIQTVKIRMPKDERVDIAMISAKVV